jgi:hypothetical protein
MQETPVSTTIDPKLLGPSRLQVEPSEVTYALTPEASQPAATQPVADAHEISLMSLRPLGRLWAVQSVPSVVSIRNAELGVPW